MVIMIVFISLSIILIIGTAIFINYKNRKMNSEQKDIVTKENKKNTKENSKKKLANILSIKIKDNVICLDNNRYSSVIKLGNIDYNMLNETEQETIENILIQTALSMDYPIQFFTTTEFIDTSKVIKEIKENKAKNTYIEKYQKYLIEYLEELMRNKTISVVKNYAVISYCGSYENAITELNRKTLSLKSSLLRTKVACDILNENELYNLIYKELNKDSDLKIDNLKKVGNLYVGKKQKSKK